jgi:hypothetical protein
MKASLLRAMAVVLTFLLSACVTARPGGRGAVTVRKSNPSAIIIAAQSVFTHSGYSAGPVSFPDSVSFDKPTSVFGNLMWGTYDEKASIRVKISINQIPGTDDYVLSSNTYSVTSAGEAGFEDATKRSRLWFGEARRLLRQVPSLASGAGPTM